jgi:hypothetical protein
MLPESFHVLPAIVPFQIPGFQKQYLSGDRTFAPTNRDCAELFEAFYARVLTAIGHEYLPVLRMSDGEFHFCLGPQPPFPNTARARLRALASRLRTRFRGFVAGPRGVYSSGIYSSAEWRLARATCAANVRALAERGILALHVSFREGAPFQERFFPALRKWLADHQIGINERNYVPFYFVYALLSGPHRRSILEGRRVLLVNGADPEKQGRIERSLRELGVREIHWIAISGTRSLFERVDPQPFVGKIDIAFVGAGVGKPSILPQLEPLAVPCIDVGYLFEVWANPALASNRPFCVPD